MEGKSDFQLVLDALWFFYTLDLCHMVISPLERTERIQISYMKKGWRLMVWTSAVIPVQPFFNFNFWDWIFLNC